MHKKFSINERKRISLRTTQEMGVSDPQQKGPPRHESHSTSTTETEVEGPHANRKIQCEANLEE